jgi:hypothetical protein
VAYCTARLLKLEVYIDIKIDTLVFIVLSRVLYRLERDAIDGQEVELVATDR